ncbi:MAG: cytochrome b/b6 domain-containing protein [Deltaproteobacteria bacterium]|nr:cytochrome b/b6 domain-containing protein [Candidatus Zymogenaceae bacterium]
MGENEWILKHSTAVRMFHYVLAPSFVVLALSGLVLFFDPFGEQAMNTWMKIHVVLGVILTIDVIGYLLIGFDKVALFIKRVFAVNKNDLKWFAVLGGYPQKFILRKKVEVPPMEKYNSGQKLFGVCVIIGGALLLWTGWGLWALPHVLPRGLTLWFGHLHLIVGWGLILFLLVHVFLGIYMFDDFKSMFLDGRIPYEKAKEASPLWVERELVEVKE